MLDNFNFDLLNDPEFKENSVREEIVAPILNNLGYYASSSNKIIRSKSLTHPFVYIGTTQRKINIIPDYLLQSDNQNLFILDAKGPNENIHAGKNVEQAFSYAIHQEIRVPRYALCNGHEITIFDVSKYKPIEIINVKEIDAEWKKVEKLLSPLAFSKPYLFDFKPDLGLSFLQMGSNLDTDFHFIGAWVTVVCKVSEDLYTISSGLKFDTEEFCASFDFKPSQFEQFLNSVPEDKRELIKEHLSRMPYHIIFKPVDVFEVIVHARLCKRIEYNENEDYMPFDVISFEKIKY